MKKQILALFFALALLTGVTPAWAAREYPEWAADSWQILDDWFINLKWGVKGYSSRGDIASCLVDCLDSSLLDDMLPYVTYAESEETRARFSDPDSEYYSVDNKAIAYGILEGTVEADGRRYLRPRDRITREQAAKMVCSALDVFEKFSGIELPAAGEPAIYTDQTAISPWAVPYTSRIASYGLMKGDQHGNFNPLAEITSNEAAVLLRRTSDLMRGRVSAAVEENNGLFLRGSRMDWGTLYENYTGTDTFHTLYNRSMNYHLVDNGDDTLSILYSPPDEKNKLRPEWITGENFYVERYDAQGNAVELIQRPMELNHLCAFCQDDDYYYLAFGAGDLEENGAEITRIVKYDRDWNRLGAASVRGDEAFARTYFSVSSSEMALSPGGETLVLHTGAQLYSDAFGTSHQAAQAVVVKTGEMTVDGVWGTGADSLWAAAGSPKREYNLGGVYFTHVGNAFVEFDGEDVVFAAHTDTAPERGFLLDVYYDPDSPNVDAQLVTLWEFAGRAGNNKTNASGRGLAVSDTHYLFLGNTSTQQSMSNTAMRSALFLVDKQELLTKGEDAPVERLWITPMENDENNTWPDWKVLDPQNDEDAGALWLLEAGEDTFVLVMHSGKGSYLLTLDGEGNLKGKSEYYPWLPRATMEPVVQEGCVRWIERYEYQEHVLDNLAQSELGIIRCSIPIP